MEEENQNEPGAVQDGSGIDPETPPDPAIETPPAQSLEFQHETLRGRSPAEVEQYVALLENTAREQAAQLNANSRLNQPVEPTAPTGRDLPTDDQFYDSPVQAVSQVVDRGIGQLRGEMSQMIQPFRRDFAEQALERELGSDEWRRFKPTVEMLVQRSGGDPTNVDLLRNFYYTAKGYAAREAERSGQVTQPASQTQAHAQENSVTPPQHRPSSAPLPNRGDQQAQVRQLTENERRLAREYGMTPEEYVYWADDVMPESVVGAEFERSK